MKKLLCYDNFDISISTKNYASYVSLEACIKRLQKCAIELNIDTLKAQEVLTINMHEFQNLQM